VRISLVVAASSNDVIGVDGGLPWHLPEDLRRFKQLTMDKPVVMGRATWESIGRPLPGRRMIVLTNRAGYVAEGCEVVKSLEAALHLVAEADEVMIIGGGTVYRQALPLADRIYLTRVHCDVSGDTFFPPIVASDWVEVARETYALDDSRPYAFDILTLDRPTADEDPPA